MTQGVVREFLFFLLTLVVVLFNANRVQATTIEAPTNVPTEVQISQTFSFNTNITSVQAGEIYFVKCRLGQTSTTLNEGQTYNSVANTWLSDTSSWKDFPTITISGDSVSTSIQCRTKSNISTGQKLVYASACLKKSDGSCGSGSSFKSSSGATINVVTSSSSTPTPSPTSNPSPSPTPSPFIVSNFPSQINSDQSFNAFINLSLSSNPNISFYLKGAFKKLYSSNYFGKTLVYGSWVKNGSSYSNQFPITTDSSGNWSGNLEVQPDSEDSGYSGTGDYLFKVGRYTQSGSGPTWSNETNIKITSVTSTEQGGVVTTASSIVTPQTSPSSSSKINPLVYRIATVAGASASATPSATAKVKSKKSINIIIWIGGLLIISGVGLLIYIYLRKRKI